MPGQFDIMKNYGIISRKPPKGGGWVTFFGVAM
jgi:hypothetical protein